FFADAIFAFSLTLPIAGSSSAMRMARIAMTVSSSTNVNAVVRLRGKFILRMYLHVGQITNHFSSASYRPRMKNPSITFQESWLSAPDGARLFTRCAAPPEDSDAARANVLLVHGMGEHSARYF